jgi:hypothetical protein
MRKLIFVLFYFFSTCTILSAQNSEFKLQNYHPASPTAFQFIKYTELPVSQYTGVADVSVPIHQIDEDGVTIPLKLGYHGGGIRVSEEASWVGLGWDLQVGSIVQEINDMDDYGSGITRIMPDWNESPVPSLYSKKYSDMAWGTLTPGYSNTVSVDPPKSRFSYRIYTSYLESVGASGPYFSSGFTGVHYYYLPLNGSRDNQPLATDLIESPNYDSEPDIFSANFAGYSIKFIRDPQNSQIIVLNKKGYLVTRTGDVYKIIVPSGEEYYFEQFSTVTSYSTTIGGIGVAGLSNSDVQPSSKIWMLTKIITNNKRQVTFNYLQSATVNNYPSYSEKSSVITSSTVNSLGNNMYAEGYTNFPGSGIGKTYGYSTENKLTISSITTPNSEITFSTSARNDMIGGRKLDAITITSGGSVVKSYQLTYSYFDASGVGGNKFHPSNENSFGNMADLRLKLLSVQDNSGAKHEFTYNSTILPSKNSIAQDFWGFYNGQLTNTSLIPNPARLTAAQLCNATNLGDNGNNNSANLVYAQAGVLTSIKYPTGGNINLEYELNTFDNYWVPDFSSTSNQISSGNGLRIKSITYQAVNNINSKKTRYTYSGGKALSPLTMCRTYPISSLGLNITGSSNGSITGYQIVEFNAKGFYGTNSLGSGNSVGYGQVTREEVDGLGNTLGKIETNYNIRPDNTGVSANGSPQLSISLPSVKQITSTYGGVLSDYPENGTVVSEKIYKIYNNQIKLIKESANTYQTGVSDVYYGARMFGCASEYIVAGTTAGSLHWVSIPRTMAGYYPIFDIESLLTRTVLTEYDDNNNSLTTTEDYSYNVYSILIGKTISGSKGYSYEQYYRPDNPYLQNGVNLLWTNNRLTEITRKISGSNNNGRPVKLSDNYKEYLQLGDKIVVNRMLLRDNPLGNNTTTTISYDQYDSYGNPVQVTKNGEVNSLLWDYNGKYLVAEIKNAANSQTAFTSFESDGNGNWTVPSSVRDNTTAITGKKSYNIINGQVTKSGLNTSGIYIVSYWSKTGAKSVNGSAAVTGQSVNGWVYYAHTVSSPAGGVITVSGSGAIDELRLYPQTSLMLTYTVIPLVGLSSECDANNRITYYDYDASGRLSLIKDQYQYIIKKICYNYAGQAEDCPLQTNTGSVWRATGNTRCQLCATNNAYNSGVREKEEKDINPASATSGTLRWVTDPSGTCPSPPNWVNSTALCEQYATAPFEYTGNQLITQVDINPCSLTYNQTQQIVISNTASCPVCNPACNAPSQKCINGTCVTGTWSIIKVVKNGKSGPWDCTYAYCFPDGTVSSFKQVVSSSTACTVTCF